MVYSVSHSSKAEAVHVITKFVKASPSLAETLREPLFLSIVLLAVMLLVYNFKTDLKKELEELRQSLKNPVKTYLAQYMADYLNTLVEKLDVSNGQLFPENKEEVKSHNKSIIDTLDFVFKKSMPEKNAQDNLAKINAFVVRLIDLKSKCQDAALFVDKKLARLVDEKRVAEHSPELMQTIVQHVLSQVAQGSFEVPNDGMRDLVEEIFKMQGREFIANLLDLKVLEDDKALSSLFSLVAAMVDTSLPRN